MFDPKDMSISGLVDTLNRKQLTFSIDIQRGFRWDLRRQSELIYSVVKGFPIGIMYFNKITNREKKKKFFHGFDGQQRSITLQRYLNDEFAVSKNIHAELRQILDDDGNAIDIAGKKFSELPSRVQTQIKERSLNVWQADNAANDEMREFFRLINNGMPVSSLEKLMTRIDNREAFMELAKHNVFVYMSDSQKLKRLDEKLAFQVWVMCYSEIESLLNKDIDPTTAKPTEEQIVSLNQVFDYLATVLAECQVDKKVLASIKKPVHFVSVAYAAYKAIEKGVSQEVFAEKIITFFTTEPVKGKKTKATVSDEYNRASRESTSSAESVGVRKRELQKLLD